MRLHWGMRSEDDLFLVDNLERLSGEYSNFVFDVVLSKPSDDWDLCTGHVQDCLSRDFTLGLADWSGYVCGNPEIVLDITNTLVNLGMKPDNIYHEKFA